MHGLCFPVAWVTKNRMPGIGEVNAKRWLRTGKCSFLPEEREWLERLKGWGLQDSFRTLNPEVVDRFSWFDYRSRGFEDDPRRGLRIDYILTTAALHQRVTDCGVDYEIRAMEKREPPFRVIAPGRVFRQETTDASHDHTFYQMEGLVVWIELR